MKRRTRRGERLNLRLTKSQRARIEEEAEAEGISMTDLIVRRACGESSDHGSPVPSGHDAPDHGGSHIDVPGDFEQRVAAHAVTMPRSNAERQVRREEARERAKEALAGSG